MKSGDILLRNREHFVRVRLVLKQHGVAEPHIGVLAVEPAVIADG